MSFGSAIKANKISSRENSEDDNGNNINEAVKQSQSTIPSEQSNTITTTTYKKKDSSSSSEQRLSTTTSALDQQLNLSIENITLQNTLQDLSTKYKALELQLLESERLKVENEVLRRRQSVEGINSNNNEGGNEQINVKTKKQNEDTTKQKTYKKKDSSTSGISVDESFVTHDELMEENVRLTQLILDVSISYMHVDMFCCVCVCCVGWLGCVCFVGFVYAHLIYIICINGQ